MLANVQELADQPRSWKYVDLLISDGMNSLLIASIDFCQPAISKLKVYMVITMNLSTDFYIMSIPLPVCGTRPHFPRTSANLITR